MLCASLVKIVLHHRVTEVITEKNGGLRPGQVKLMSDQSIGKHFLEEALRTFRNYKKLGERAFARISDEDFFRTIDEESNSIAVNVKHIAGNMLSRWTDFLTTDGEKPERNRDMEFVMLPETTRDE